MAHKTKFDDMCELQRRLHNLTCIMDTDDDIATYESAVSAAIDRITLLRSVPPALNIFAWALFDGEGSYDLVLYENNEGYRDDYIKRNGEKYAGWVTPLYACGA